MPSLPTSGSRDFAGSLRWLAYGSVPIAAAYQYRWVVLAWAGVFRPIDFYSFYTGGALVRDGFGERLYDFSLQAQYQVRILGRFLLDGHLLPYVSPPHVALLILPLSLMPLPTALAVWLSFQLVLVVVLALMCLKADARFTPHERLLLLASIFAYPMLTVTIYKGQLSLILLLCTLGWVCALRNGRDSSLAACLLVGTVKPQFILMPLLLTILARRWKALIILAVGTVGLVLSSVSVLGWSSLSGFLNTVQRTDSDVSGQIAYPAYMYNFKGFLSLVGGLRHVGVLRILVSAGLVWALLATMALWRGRVEVGDPTFDLKMALSLLFGIFFCPHLYYYDSLMLVSVGYPFLRHLLLDAGNTLLRLVVLGSVLMLPPFFLESAWVSFGDITVRWPAVFMITGMAGMTIMLRRGSLASPSSRSGACKLAS